MRVFVAGATGTLGRPLVRALVQKGYEVVGLTRSSVGRAQIEKLGARAVVADALDAAGLLSVVQAAPPTHVAHVLTALPAAGPMRARDLRATNTLRTTGTRNLLRAAIAAGARRMVAESFMGVYGAIARGASGAPPVLDESASLPDPPPGLLRPTILALRDKETQLRDAAGSGALETVALRFAAFYGPGVPSTEGAVAQIRKGRVLAPAGDGVVSFIHIDDAVSATIAALEAPSPGHAYNVADDRPMTIYQFMTIAAAAFGGRPPRRVPQWLLRILAPVPAAAASYQLALSNARLKRELGWALRHPTAIEGLRQTADVLTRQEGKLEPGSRQPGAGSAHRADVSTSPSAASHSGAGYTRT